MLRCWWWARARCIAYPETRCWPWTSQQRLEDVRRHVVESTSTPQTPKLLTSLTAHPVTSAPLPHNTINVKTTHRAELPIMWNTQCHWDPEVVTVLLFTLATVVFVLKLIVNTVTVKISVGFFRFPSNLKEFKKWEHLSRLNLLIDTNVIAIVNKKLVNRTVSFDKWASAS